MWDKSKTKEQLIDELVKLRQRVAEFEALEAERQRLKKSRGIQIGEILMEMGCLTRLQLDRTLREQKEATMVSQMLDRKHKRLGAIMVDSGIITEEQLHKALAEQLRRLDYRHR